MILHSERTRAPKPSQQQRNATIRYISSMNFRCLSFVPCQRENYLVYDCGQVLGAGQGLEELYTQQGGHGVRQRVLDGAGRCGDTKDEHQRKTFNVPTVE